MKADRKPKPILVNGKPINVPLSWKVDRTGAVVMVKVGK
jgi:hypothetical protein